MKTIKTAGWLLFKFPLIVGATFALCCLMAVGCHAQVAPNPTVYTCPASSATAYTPLNQASPATGLTYTDSKPVAGTFCYVAQSVSGSQVSAPSNTAGPLTTNGSNSVDLTWTAPSSGPVPAGYVLSRAPAVASTMLAPALGTSPTVAMLVYYTGTALPSPTLTAKLAK